MNKNILLQGGVRRIFPLYKTLDSSAHCSATDHELSSDHVYSREGTANKLKTFKEDSQNFRISPQLRISEAIVVRERSTKFARYSGKLTGLSNIMNMEYSYYSEDDILMAIILTMIMVSMKIILSFRILITISEFLFSHFLV